MIVRRLRARGSSLRASPKREVVMMEHPLVKVNRLDQHAPVAGFVGGTPQVSLR